MVYASLADVPEPYTWDEQTEHEYLLWQETMSASQLRLVAVMVRDRMQDDSMDFVFHNCNSVVLDASARSKVGPADSAPLLDMEKQVWRFGPNRGNRVDTLQTRASPSTASHVQGTPDAGGPPGRETGMMAPVPTSGRHPDSRFGDVRQADPSQRPKPRGTGSGIIRSSDGKEMQKQPDFRLCVHYGHSWPADGDWTGYKSPWDDNFYFADKNGHRWQRKPQGQWTPYNEKFPKPVRDAYYEWRKQFPPAEDENSLCRVTWEKYGVPHHLQHLFKKEEDDEDDEPGQAGSSAAASSHMAAPVPTGPAPDAPIPKTKPTSKASSGSASEYKPGSLIDQLLPGVGDDSGATKEEPDDTAATKEEFDDQDADMDQGETAAPPVGSTDEPLSPGDPAGGTSPSLSPPRGSSANTPAGAAAVVSVTALASAAQPANGQCIMASVVEHSPIIWVALLVLVALVSFVLGYLCAKARATKSPKGVANPHNPSPTQGLSETRIYFCESLIKSGARAKSLKFHTSPTCRFMMGSDASKRVLEFDICQGCAKNK